MPLKITLYRFILLIIKVIILSLQSKFNPKYHLLYFTQKKYLHQQSFKFQYLLTKSEKKVLIDYIKKWRDIEFSKQLVMELTEVL